MIVVVWTIRQPALVAAAMFVSVVAVVACATESSTAELASTSGASASQAAMSTSARASERRRRSDARGTHHRVLTPMLIYSTASNNVVQREPPPGSCRAIGQGLYSRPDPRCTPGALNPAVTQASIDRTICRAGWTSTVRPPESVTEQEKAASMAAYGDERPMGSYEYDHFVPLELGGATNDRRNLWPEPGAVPNPKDAVEAELNRRVCDGQMTLAKAQQAIIRNWVAVARAGSSPRTTSSPSTGSGGSSGSARCVLSARYNSRYADYDVHVSSNQADQLVTVTDASGHRGSWRTNASGYADVYFHSGGPRPGDRITARVARAVCTATL
jgi:hypothetical protein